MTRSLLIYGATGYTGRLVAERAREAGLSFTVAGRDQAGVRALAERLDVPWRALALNDSHEIRQRLQGFAAVLNCAGPFARTAEPLIDGCLANGVDYLDITAEYDVYALAEARSDDAARAGVMLMPGVGWDVVPTDCLAVHVARQVKAPQSLRIALQVAGSMSRGSAISAAEIVRVGLLKRIDGRIVATPHAPSAEFNFGEGYVEAFPLSFGDLVTAWKSTGVPNIEMFVHVAGGAFPEGDLSSLPDGPTPDERDAHLARAVAEVTGEDGAIACALIETVSGYNYTPLAAVEAARRLLAAERAPGFQTPASLFGEGFALTIAGTRLIDL